MSLFDAETDIGNIPPKVHRELTNELSENSAWKIVASYLVEECNVFDVSWLKTLERKSRLPNAVPGGELLMQELSERLCTVGSLCTILRVCNILEALYLLSGPEPLRIIEQPQSDKNERLNLPAVGELFKLSCEATGLPPPKYQWFHEEKELTDQKSSDLSILVTSPDQEGRYRCRVSNYGRDNELLEEIYSEFASLKIKPVGPFIIKEPLPVEVIVGNCFVISCKAEGYPSPQYQWFKDNIKLDGETSEMLRKENVRLKDAGVYYCYVRNEVGDTISNKTKVKVEPPAEKALAKIALLIGNSDYENEKKLTKPENDVATIAKELKKLDFHVVCLKNLTRVEMKNAIEMFSRALIPGVYGFFYFAGHGFKMHQSHMMPIDVPQSLRLDDTIFETELLELTLKNNPAFLVVLLDMCLVVPDKYENKTLYKEHPKLIEYRNNKNLIVAYSTCNFEPSHEGQKAENGFYVPHLIKHIGEPKQAVTVFQDIAQSVSQSKKGGFHQTPQMYTVMTKPYRLTDAINKSKPLNQIVKTVITETTFEPLCIWQEFRINETAQQVKLIVEPIAAPFLNGLKITIPGAENCHVEFIRYDIPLENNLTSSLRDNQTDITFRGAECRIYNPQRHHPEARLLIIITIAKNDLRLRYYGKCSYMDYIPAILRNLNRQMNHQNNPKTKD